MVALVVAASSCARFDDSLASPFEPEPTAGAYAHIQPSEPEDEDSDEEREIDGPCVDPDPAVIATCLEPISGVTVLPAGDAALAAERVTGRILLVGPDIEPEEFVQIPVDSSGDGGLLDIALSPTFAEDRLLYALITTPSDNRVVRITPGDVPKVVLAGIPRGQTGNQGSLMFEQAGTLLVRTGDAGNAASSADPASLAGKALRVGALNPDGSDRPVIVASGLRGTGGACVDPVSQTVYVTESSLAGDRLVRVSSDGSTEALWSWTDGEGAGHCVVVGTDIAVVLSQGEAVSFLTRDDDTGLISGDPAMAAEGRFGKLHGAALGLGGEIWSGTINKASGDPGETDDRVVLIPTDGGGGAVGPD
ncbi:hypothetical protein GCM10011410_00380 [Hoyosella rhizosphaerae]|uniref:Glucose/Sorbosone dehydrogenase domain-containing protein n=2 Tax=Hoyosella rhizosphaerae TaxID=1755582 RepID=A0A916TZ32_9ACTN|nr:hypothetical protein GCM10011410_00380 [Hoyosella rhizosphaerae]